MLRRPAPAREARERRCKKERGAELRETAAVAPRRERRERADEEQCGGREPHVEVQRRVARGKPQQVEERGAAHVCKRVHVRSCYTGTPNYCSTSTE